MIPIVLHHGLFGYDKRQIGPWKITYFHGVDRAIAAAGYKLLTPRVHPTGAIPRRAQQLKDSILQSLPIVGGQPQGRVAIIAHSLGGLDVRYMLDKLDMARHVSALVSITTPHHGSPFADWAVRYIGQRLGILSILKFFGLDIEGLLAVTTERCREFNDSVRDVDGVRYLSVSAARPRENVPPFAVHAHKIVYDAEGDNDGIVSVTSSTWGQHMGVWPADHWHTINLRFATEPSTPTGDIAPYYLRILDRLAEQGLLEE